MRQPRGKFRRVAAIALVPAILSLCLASTASARRLIFWSNSLANKISYAPVIEGGKGADLPIAQPYVDDPYGTAIDSAAGKVYWLNRGSGGSIGYANLDGSSAGLLNTSGASFAQPSGLAIDPVAGKIYWGNSESGNGSIGFAGLNGSGGGLLKPSGATVEPAAVTVDPAKGRIYWSSLATNEISYAGLDGSSARDIDTSGAVVDGPDGIAIAARTSRVYWANREGNSIAYAGIDGGGGGTTNLNQFVSKPIGLATDSEALYWASNGFERVEAGNFAGCCVLPLETAGATQSGVAFPVILDSPRLNAIVKVEGGHAPGSVLGCSAPPWEGDQVESFLYRAPQSVSYQWLRNRQPIPGATGTTLTAAKVGSYTCQITARNFAGDNVEGNPNGFVVRASLKLKRIAYNRRKGTATLRVAVTGAGRLDLFGKGVANVSRKHVSGTVKVVVRASAKSRIALKAKGKARVKPTVSFTPEGGKAIEHKWAVALKKTRR